MKLRYSILFCLLALLIVGMLVYSSLGTGSPSVGGPKKFSSPQELDQYIREHVSQNSYGTGLLSGVSQAAGLHAVKQTTGNIPVPVAMPVSARSESSVAGPISNAVDSAGGTVYSSDYSQTNVQVAGVDEADFVKNDGRYIYVITNGQLVIADAYPGETAK